MQGNLSIERMCQMAGVSRAGFYRSLQQREPDEEDMEARSAIQSIFAEHKRRYGYRRVSKELRRRGLRVNRKRVQRLMRVDNLLAIQPKAFVITTDSNHDLEVYLNLASRMKLTGINQLWVTETKLTECWSNRSMSRAKSSKDRLRRSTLYTTTQPTRLRSMSSINFCSAGRSKLPPLKPPSS